MRGKSRQRALATVVAAWAERLLPSEKVAWGSAMQNELPQIEEDWEAVLWALGCLAAAFHERIGIMKVLDSLPARLVMVIVMVLKVVDDLFATALTAAYRLGALGVAEGLGQQTAGDDYTRLIPVMQAVPVWIHALWVLAALLFLAAIILVLLRRNAALVLVLAAMGLEIAAQVAGKPIIAATGVVVNPHPSVITGVVIPYAIPLGLAAAIWLAGRAPPRRVAQE